MFVLGNTVDAKNVSSNQPDLQIVLPRTDNLD